MCFVKKVCFGLHHRQVRYFINTVMLTRRAEQELVDSLVEIEAVPPELRGGLVEHLRHCPPDVKLQKTSVIKFAASYSEGQQLMSLSNARLAQVFRCSATIVSRVKTALAEPPEAPGKTGRPSLLSPDEEAQLCQWVRERSAGHHWVTVQELKRHVLQILESKNVENFPSRAYFSQLTSRLLSAEYDRRSAEVLESARTEVSQQDVNQYFTILAENNVMETPPDLLINIDETGFGASKSGRVKSAKVFVPKGFAGRLYVPCEAEKHYVSAICAITAGGSCLPPGLIIKRKPSPCDLDTLAIGAKIPIYTAEKAFVTRKIFQDYLADVVVPYICEVRERLGKPDAKACIIWDGHSSHYDELTGAFAAIHGISLISIPPHSSHLLQPLDRQFFRRVKQFYSLYGPRPGLVKVTATILRAVQSIESAAVASTIVKSWEMTGVCPVVEDREVVKICIDPQRIVVDKGQQRDTPAGAQGRGRKTKDYAFGLLNGDQHDFLEAGQCPYCMAPLDETCEF